MNKARGTGGAGAKPDSVFMQIRERCTLKGRAKHQLLPTEEIQPYQWEPGALEMDQE